jgi:hypothetical protein
MSNASLKSSRFHGIERTHDDFSRVVDQKINPPRTVAIFSIVERTSDSFFTSRTHEVMVAAYLSRCRDRFSPGGAPADLLRESRASLFLVLTVWPMQALIHAILLLSQRLCRQTNRAEPSSERPQMTIRPRLVQMIFSNSCSEVFLDPISSALF